MFLDLEYIHDRAPGPNPQYPVRKCPFNPNGQVAEVCNVVTQLKSNAEHISELTHFSPDTEDSETVRW